MHKDQKNKLIIIFTYSIITFLFVGVFTFSKSCRAQESFSFALCFLLGCPMLFALCSLRAVGPYGPEAMRLR